MKITKLAPGILLCFIIAIPAWSLGKLLPVIGGPIFAILMGMLIALALQGLLRGESNFAQNNGKHKPIDLQPGIKYTSKKILQYSIILIGFEMNLFTVIEVGGQSLFVMLFTLSSSFITAYVMSKVLNVEGKMATLIGVGTSICGGSAIAATAPVIASKDEDVAHAISTIFLFNIVAVFLFPALGHLFGMSDFGFGIWSGTAINDTSSVVAASTAWSEAAGNNTALATATIVKLTRTLMIVPITFILAIYTSKKTQKEQQIRTNSEFRFVKIFPWFVIGFVAAAIINTFWGIPEISDKFVSLGKFMIVMAMAAIGLNTNLKKLLTNGLKPILLGLCCWFAVASVSILIQILIKTW